MKSIVWRFVRSVMSVVVFLAVLVLVKVVFGQNISENVYVALIGVAFVGLYVVGYCPQCKFVITKRVLLAFWRWDNLNLPVCPKCEKKGREGEACEIY